MKRWIMIDGLFTWNWKRYVRVSETMKSTFSLEILIIHSSRMKIRNYQVQISPQQTMQVRAATQYAWRGSGIQGQAPRLP